MTIAKNQFRARTRGKSPKKFTFEGVGNPVARKVQDKDGNPIVEKSDGTQVEYSYEKKDGKYAVTSADGITVDDKGNLVLPNGLTFVEVDDADVESIAPKADAPAEESAAFVKDILTNLFNGDYRTLGIVALRGYNDIQRDKAAEPLRAVQTKEDELSEIVGLLREHKVIASDEAETKWRRGTTMAYEAMFGDDKSVTKLDFAYTTALGKKVADKRPAKVAA